jgi:hypothetical protein
VDGSRARQNYPNNRTHRPEAVAAEMGQSRLMQRNNLFNRRRGRPYRLFMLAPSYRVLMRLRAITIRLAAGPALRDYNLGGENAASALEVLP